MACCASDMCWPINRERKVIERPTNMGRKVLHPVAIMSSSFKVKRSNSGGASYLPNWKAYELQTWYTVRAWRPASRSALWPPKSKVMVTRSPGPSDRCWPISREQKVPETAKLIGRLSWRIPISRSKGQRSRSPVDYYWNRKCIIPTER